MQVDANGVTVLDNATGVLEGAGLDGEYEGGFVYSTAGHILDPECDSHQDIRTLQTHSVDRVMYRFAEEVRLASWVWRLGTMHRQRIRQSQGSTKSAAVTVTTVAGHLRTVA